MLASKGEKWRIKRLRLGLQSDYDLDVAADELGERLEREVQVRAKAS